MELTHFNEQGRARMVDVSEKVQTYRVARAAAAVAACGFDARVRGETLDPAQFAALSNALRAQLG